MDGKLFPLKPYSSFRENALFWNSAFLIFKATEFNKNLKEPLDIEDHINRFYYADDFDVLLSIGKELIVLGIKSLAKTLASLSHFYEYGVINIASKEEINNKNMLDFQQSLHSLSEGTRKTYFDSILEYLRFIETYNQDGFVFGLDYESLRLKRGKTKRYDAMSEEEFLHFSKMLPVFEYKNEFEKCRTVLICRIMLYSGIAPRELASLKLGKSLVSTQRGFYLQLDNRDVKICLPKSKINSYFSTYCKLKADIKDGYFFYPLGEPNAMLSAAQINKLIKSMLIKSGIQKEELNARLLRASFAVYLYRYRLDGKQYHLSAIQKILGHGNRNETEKLIGMYSKSFTQTNHVFNGDDFE